MKKISYKKKVEYGGFIDVETLEKREIKTKKSRTDFLRTSDKIPPIEGLVRLIH